MKDNWPFELVSVNVLLVCCKFFLIFEIFNPYKPSVLFVGHRQTMKTPIRSGLYCLLTVLVQEPVIGLIKWLRPKGLKVCSYAEKCAEFKNQTLKKIGWYTTKVLCTTEYPGGMQYLKIALKWGPLQVYTLNHVIYI